MRVDIGFFEGDELLHRGALDISSRVQTEASGNLKFTHQLQGESAEIVIEVYSNGRQIIKSTLDMPVHQSDDWESIELSQFTLAFKCSTEA